jgi:pimeloyl-ACP methyl ester carboxylesterase
LIRIGKCMLALAATLLISACAGSSSVSRFHTTDGFTIVADVIPSESPSAPVVFLAHQLERDRTSWAPLLPYLTRAGWAVVALDHRGFGESTAEAAGPEELSSEAQVSFDRDWEAVFEGLAAERGWSLDRIAIVASGFSVTPAVRFASAHRSVVSLVLLTGNVEPPEEEFLMRHPGLPILLVAASMDERGAGMMRSYAAKLVGPQQEYLEIEPGDWREPGNWRGTDGFATSADLADEILRFLRATLPGEATP